MSLLVEVPPQHEVALVRANYVRKRRAQLRREIGALEYRAARARTADVLLAPPDWLDGQRILDFLCWPKRMASTKVVPALGCRRIGEFRTIGSLTPRQAADLAEALRLPGSFV